MKGYSNLGAASRRENEFRATGGRAKTSESFRYRCRSRSRYRRVRRGFDGRAARPLGDFAALRLCGLSDSCSGVLSCSGDAIGCSCSCGGRGSVAPLGLGVHGARNPALTRWAIICRPSGPGATAWRARGWLGVSGLPPVLLIEFSIPMPIPIAVPIPSKTPSASSARPDLD
jgi:hypothetical protein